MQSQSQAKQRRQFKAYQTILQIMQARGYVVSSEAKDMKFEQFVDGQQRATLQKQVFCPLEQSQEHTPITVFYNFAGEKIDPEYITKRIQIAKDVHRLFIVVPSAKGGKIDKKVEAFVHELGRKDDKFAIRVELFAEEDLLFNVLKHDLVPEFEVLSESSKKALMAKYKVKESQLPKILLNDPVARFLGLRRGQVVKVIRNSQTAGKYTTYRITV